MRNYCIAFSLLSLFPYDQVTAQPINVTASEWMQHFWRYRTNLKNRKDFGQFIEDRGLRWFDHSMFFPARFRNRLSIAFAFVATHNHFVLDRGGKVFKQSAPIIKLPVEATEGDHIALLGLLNSSTMCFWMKQTFHDKGGGGIGGGIAQEFWEHFFEFTGTGVQQVPICEGRPLDLAQQLDDLAQQYATRRPESVVKGKTPTVDRNTRSRDEAMSIRRQMIACQEELDWLCYQLYGLLSEDLRYVGHDLPELVLGQRAFEIVVARQMAKGEITTTWFDRHDSTPITEIPSHWPDAYQELVRKRIDLIETVKEIRLIERPEYKRRWNDEPWGEQEQRTLRNWLLDRLESKRYWPDSQQQPTLQTTAQLTDKASGDDELIQVAVFYRGRSDFDMSALVAELIGGEAVPSLPVLRYKPAGLRKHAIWERTWELQRRGDAGEDVEEIAVPPKYTTADFQKTDYWRLRGKLDVPKERWISYPHCEREGDPSLVVGWAGWDHVQQATALVAYYDTRKREGWTAERLTPLLAGIDQLLPWIHQWHPEIDPEYNETAGTSFQTLLESEVQGLGLTLEDIRNWVPPKKTTRRRKGKS